MYSLGSWLVCLYPNRALQKPAWAAFCKPLSCFVYASPSSAFNTAHFLSKEFSVPPVPSGDNDLHSPLLTLWGCLQIHKPLQPPHRAFEEPFLKVHTAYLIVNSSHLDAGHVCIRRAHYFIICFPVLLVTFKMVSERLGFSIPCLP